MKLLLLLLISLASVSVAFRQQSVGIRGRIFCGTKPLAGTQVKLWNKNKLTSDDELGSTKTDDYGNFELRGGVGSVFELNVHLNVYHDCADGIMPCQRKVDLGVPSEYVTRTEKVTKWFEAGLINLEFTFPDEERSCNN